MNTPDAIKPEGSEKSGRRVRTAREKLIKKNRGMTDILFLGFLVLILIGTLLLMLPVSSASHTPTGILEAGFTAVSAVCVTGLSVVDSATYWSTFGQVVILLLIQIGGLGFMTLTILISLLIRRRVTPRERMLIAQSYNLNTYDKTNDLVKRILLGTLLIEGGGALLLSTRLIPDFGWKEGIYQSVFHAVSAFCNAGFDILGRNPQIGSPAHYINDPVVNITLIFLILCGGIGFLVWGDIVNFFRNRKPLSVYSRFILILTAILFFGGALLIGIFEWNNPETIGNLPLPSKIMGAFFESATLRTAGFSSFPQGSMTENSQLIALFLMFVGGASGSTAGGVKVGTVGVLMWVVLSASAGKKNVNLFRRKISTDQFVRAVTLVVVQLFLILLSTILLSSAESFGLVPILFETVSAVSTVGLSLGITSALGAFSKVILMCLMYFGRVGILSITYALMRNLVEDCSSITYPEANLLIG